MLEQYNYNRVVTTMTSSYEGGQWHVTQEVRQSRRNSLAEKWETRVASASATSPNLDKAISECAFTVLTYLDKMGGNLFEAVEEEDDSNQSNET